MGELFTLIRKRDLKGLMVSPSNNLFIQMFRYLFVGGFAAVADFGSYALLLHFDCNKYLAAALAFVIGLLVNYILSKLLVFRKEKAKVKSSIFEFVAYGIIGVIGLGMTEFIIWFATNSMHWHALLAKLAAMAIVLIWNFAARKIFLYGGKKEA